MNRVVLNSLATTCAGEDEDLWDASLKKAQSAINSSTNRTTRVSPTQLLFGFKPHSHADARLLTEIQDVSDQVNLKELRETAKDATDAEQAEQKRRFDARRFKASQYAVGDVVMVAAAPPATGERKKLVAKAKGPFKVTAVLPNDRYEVHDLRDLKKSPFKRSVVAVDSMRRWVTFDATKT
ncbi:uncharacterized protein LOC135170612 isoform X2 [Diachasmimorpha longicaudata]|uniref:uncharacterized protein LOC135170612 isoform X2 n=1 Tax=Diachasmimorpha longicaudata TaxID=58733 RepID=UPI0030B8E019